MTNDLNQYKGFNILFIQILNSNKNVEIYKHIVYQNNMLQFV